MATAYQTPGTQASITITLASLASSSTLLVGQGSTAVASGNWSDVEVSGKTMTCGTVNPTTGTEIRVYVYAQQNDTPTYPPYGTGGNISGTDGAVTFTGAALRDASLYLARVIGIDVTTQANPLAIKPFSLVQVCGYLPKRWGIFVTQSSGQILHATAGNHEIVYLPYTWTS